MTTAEHLIDLTNLPPTLDLVVAARLLGIGRTVAYELVREDRWPTPVIRAGRKIRVPSVPLVKLLLGETQHPSGQPSRSR